MTKEGSTTPLLSGLRILRFATVGAGLVGLLVSAGLTVAFPLRAAFESPGLLGGALLYSVVIVAVGTVAGSTLGAAAGAAGGLVQAIPGLRRTIFWRTVSAALAAGVTAFLFVQFVLLPLFSQNAAVYISLLVGMVAACGVGIFAWLRVFRPTAKSARHGSSLPGTSRN